MDGTGRWFGNPNWGLKIFGEIFQGPNFAVGSNSREFLPCLFPTGPTTPVGSSHISVVLNGTERHRSPHGKLGPSPKTNRHTRVTFILWKSMSHQKRVILYCEHFCIVFQWIFSSLLFLGLWINPSMCSNHMDALQGLCKAAPWSLQAGNCKSCLWPTKDEKTIRSEGSWAPSGKLT